MEELDPQKKACIINEIQTFKFYSINGRLIGGSENKFRNEF